MTDALHKANAMKASLQAKMDTLLTEFAEGKLNREQFHVIYERYHGQLTLVEQVLRGGSPDAMTLAQGGPPTIAIRDHLMGKALGLLIVLHGSTRPLETLGQFDVPPSALAVPLAEMAAAARQGLAPERRTQPVGDGRWLLFSGGEFTAVVTLFRNEPSTLQSRELERLHRDFEAANRPALSGGRAETGQLAYPFVVFVQQRVRRP